MTPDRISSIEFEFSVVEYCQYRPIILFVNSTAKAVRRKKSYFIPKSLSPKMPKPKFWVADSNSTPINIRITVFKSHQEISTVRGSPRLPELWLETVSK